MDATQNNQPKAFRKVASRVTLPGFACVGEHVLPEMTPATVRSAATNRALQCAAASLALQGHGISIALRTLVARRSLLVNAR